MPGHPVLTNLRNRSNILLIIAAVLIAVAVIITGLRLSPQRPARPVVLATSDWAPFIGSDLPEGGPVAQIVKLALAKQGYQAMFQFTTWDLAADAVRRGSAFAAFPLTASQARADEFAVSTSIVDFEYVLFYDTSRFRPKVTSPADLGRLRVARIAGYDYWPELDAAVGDYHRYATSADAFRALAAGEVDLVPEGRAAGLALARDPALPLDVGRFGIVPGDAAWLHSHQGLHLIASKTSDSERLLRAFDRAVEEMRDTPEYQALTAQLTASAADGTDVRLTGFDGQPPTLLDEDGKPLAELPPATLAVVLEWPASVTGERPRAGQPALVRVKVADGPGQGRVGLVDLRGVELVTS